MCVCVCQNITNYVNLTKNVTDRSNICKVQSASKVTPSSCTTCGLWVADNNTSSSFLKMHPYVTRCTAFGPGPHRQTGPLTLLRSHCRQTAGIEKISWLLKTMTWRAQVQSLNANAHKQFYSYTHIHSSTRTHTYTCMYSHVNTSTHTNAHTLTFMHTHVYMHIAAPPPNTYTHTHTHREVERGAGEASKARQKTS